MVANLLPPNATTLERNAASVCAFDAVLGQVADGITSVSWARPASYSPWLAAEWRLAEFAKFFADSEALIAAGLPWLRIRGTAAAVAMALSWIGFTAKVEEDGSLLHLDPGTVNVDARLADIVQLVTASIPAHVKFYRMYHGYDVRMFKLSGSRLSAAILSDCSGVLVDGIKLSFGTRAACVLAEPPSTIDGGSTQRYCTVVPSETSWLLGSYRLSDAISRVGAGILRATYSTALEDVATAPIIVWQRDQHAVALADDSPAPEGMRTERRAERSADPVVRWPDQWITAPWADPLPSRLTQLT